MLLKGGSIICGGVLQRKDILIENGIIKKIGDSLSHTGKIIDVSGCWVIPGTIDIHGHLREPGYEKKGTIYCETGSAAKGGITAVAAMPNLRPCPDCAENLKIERYIIRRDALIDVYPYAAVSVDEKGNESADLDSMKDAVKAITDDGRGVNNLEILTAAMRWAEANDKVMCSHAEMEGYGVSPEAEYLAVEREIELAEKIGCKYHFCHISTEQAFNLIKKAQLNGVDVTCEVTPHHLTLTENDICGNTNYKMNPPLRTEADRAAAVRAVLDGTATIIATDHAPHSEADKAVEYSAAPNGIIGFETMLPVTYTALVKSGLISCGKFLELTVYNPARRLSIPYNTVQAGQTATLAAIDISHSREYTKQEILSKSRNSPFIGKSYYGFNRLTVLRGKVIYSEL